MPIDTYIYILHSGDKADETAAHSIALQLGNLPATPVVLTADQLIARHRELSSLPTVGSIAGILLGTVIAILSEAMLHDADRRAALLAAIAGSSFVSFRHYFVCRGIAPSELISRFPDIAPIYENVMLRTESDLPLVIADVKQRFSRTIPAFWRRLGQGLRVFWGTLFALFLFQINRIFALRFFLVAALAVLLFTNFSQALVVTLTAVSFFVVGLGLNMLAPLDLWPWLGKHSRWSVSFDWFHSTQFSIVPSGVFLGTGALVGAIVSMRTKHLGPLTVCIVSGFILQGVLDMACGVAAVVRFRRDRARYPADLPIDDLTCQADRLQNAMKSCFLQRQFNLTVVFAPLALLCFVAVENASALSRRFLPVWLASFTLGLFTHSLFGAALFAATAPVTRLRALTQSFLVRQGMAIRRRRGAEPSARFQIDEADLSGFAEEERGELRRFFFRQCQPAQLARWFPPRDFVFISYVWSDEENVRLAQRMDEAFKATGIDFFRDTRAIDDPFAAWREHISLALIKCTHFFVVISAGIKHGQVVLKEVETVMQRLHLERMPSVVCVANSETARLLLADRQVPLSVRLLLSCCPRVSTSDAADSRMLRYMVEQTRRQGKWIDWLTTLSPVAARHRILRMPGIVHTMEMPERAESEEASPIRSKRS